MTGRGESPPMLRSFGRIRTDTNGFVQRGPVSGLEKIRNSVRSFAPGGVKCSHELRPPHVERRSQAWASPGPVLPPATKPPPAQRAATTIRPADVCQRVFRGIFSSAPLVDSLCTLFDNLALPACRAAFMGGRMLLKIHPTGTAAPAQWRWRRPGVAGFVALNQSPGFCPC